MNRTAMIGVIFVLATLAVAQTQPAQQNQPPAQTGTAQTGTTTAAQPQAKRPPQAKTQAEFDAYKAAIANLSDGAALEKSADDFATKYPDSELRVLLYRAAMHAYQNSNNADKMQQMADKELKIDPDDPEALIGAAEVIAERTRETDLDKDQRLAQAQKYALHSLETADTDVAIPAGTPQEKIDAYKGFLRSSAYSVLGSVNFTQEKFPDAEAYFRKSIDAFPAQPDPVVVLRLALALDKQGRYPDALKEANRAVQLTQENTSAGTLARREKDRLVQLTGGTPGASNSPASKAPETAPNPNPQPH